jgi:hypothetical protein
MLKFEPKGSNFKNPSSNPHSKKHQINFTISKETETEGPLIKTAQH